MKGKCLTLAALLVSVKSQDSSLNCNHYGLYALDKCNFEDDGTSYKYTCEDSTEGDGLSIWRHQWDNLKCFREAGSSFEITDPDSEWRCDASSNCASDRVTGSISTDDDCGRAYDGAVEWWVKNQCVRVDDDTYRILNCKEGTYNAYVDSSCSGSSIPASSYTSGECTATGFTFLCGTRMDNIGCNYYEDEALGRCYSYSYDSTTYGYSSISRSEYSYMFECKKGEIWRKYWDYSLACEGAYSSFEPYGSGDEGFKCRQGNDCASFKIEYLRYAKDYPSTTSYCLDKDRLYSRSVSYVPEKKCLPDSYFDERWTIYECGNNITTTIYDNAECEGEPVFQYSDIANADNCFESETSSTYVKCSASTFTFQLSIVGSVIISIYHLFV